MENKPAENRPAPLDIKGEFVCNAECCAGPRSRMKIGKKWATALAGFLAGAAVATIILYPWMVFLGEICDSDQASSILPSENELAVPPEPSSAAPVNEVPQP